MGGVREWLWKGPAAPKEALIEVLVDNPRGRQELRHALSIGENGGRFEVVDERIENKGPDEGKTDPHFFYRFQRGHPILNEVGAKPRKLRRESVKPDQSVLSQVRDPERYPEVAALQEQYEAIQLYRSWSFGPTASLRLAQSAHARSDFLMDGGENLGARALDDPAQGEVRISAVSPEAQ